MASTKALWTFDETDAIIQPIDLAGNVQPLQLFGSTPPQVVPGIFGNARRFGGGFAQFFGTPVVAGFAGEVALRRSMTFEALVLPTSVLNTTQVIAQYGGNSSAAERTTWSFGIRDLAGAKSLVASWARVGGAIAVVPNLPVTLPSGWIYLVAVREWLSATLAYVHWYVNGEFVGSVTSTEADIENGENAFVYIGTGAGTNQLFADLDTVRLSEGVRTPEEIRQFYRRLFVFGGYGYELLRSLLPPGESYSTSPTSFIQRELMVAGDALGYAWAKFAELADDFLPDRAWSELDRWEDVTGLAPLPSASIDERRARVLAFLRKVHGYSRTDIKLSVAELLKAAPEDLVIVENSNTYTEAFDAALTDHWTLFPSQGTISVASGKLVLDFQIGDSVQHYEGVLRNGVIARLPFAAQKRSILMAQIDVRTLPNVGFVGLIKYESVRNYFVEFGILMSGGSARFCHRLFDSNNSDMVETLGPVVPADPIWLRFEEGSTGCKYHDSTAVAYDGPWLVAIPSVPSPAGAFTEWTWNGVLLSCDQSPTIALGGADVLDFRLYEPANPYVFSWYLYRDPTLNPTDYDIEGAQLVINKVRPAHTLGTVIESLAARCDDPFSLCDREPLGV